MDRNVLLAVILAMTVYVGWFGWMDRHTPKTPAQTSGTVGGSTAAAPSAGGSGAPASATAPASGANSAAAAKSDKQPIASFSTPEAEIKFCAEGASICSYRYRGPLGMVELVAPGASFFDTWPQVAFKQVANAPTPTFKAALPGGIEVEKQYEFPTFKSLGELRLTFTNRAAAPAEESVKVGAGPGIDTVASDEKDNPKMWRAIGLGTVADKERFQKLEAGDHSGDWRWLGIDNRYFIAAVAPQAKTGYTLDQPLVNGAKAPLLEAALTTFNLKPGQTQTIRVPFYLGPKAYSRIKLYGIGLERAVDFGWFDSVGRLILRALHLVYRGTGNYGWSIVLLTMALQLMLFPLTYKSLKAASAMKKIQPELAKIQQKFKDDPQRLNMEMMQLYKSRGVNPLGGCLPMLLQLPIFVALFNALRNAWDLHGAPFMFWIHDLSAQDPYYVLPVMTAGVMFAQNKTNPAVTADPNQAQMMMWMPLIFLFMFLKFPAGLALYWFTNSLMNLLQQMFLRKRFA